MMIELTVKTLDSQNHQFSVEDDITVEQFKARIAEEVSVPADTQRIIYCGRVLQDESKLADYDVHGKVVHLVERPPPGSNPRPSSRSTSPQPQRRGRGFRGLEQGNAMYLGSMAFPGNLMESQGIVPPPPTHSLSGSRLNVAKRMLRRAEGVVLLLENPSALPQEQSPPEENHEEEVTPIIEARVLVPSSNEPIDEVLSAVQNTLINASAGTLPLPILDNAPSGSGSSAQSNTESAQRSPNQSETSTPGGPTPRSSSTENLAPEPRPDNSSPNGLPENASRTSEMAELLTMLGQLQTRFAPFLERYQNFMQEDPEVVTENRRQTQTMLNRVSEVLHFLGHAYHSLSDIIIRVRTPPPRPLLCRPILIQHSAVVQAGIPIQVEGQINLSTRNRAPNNGQATNAAVDTTNAATDTTNAVPTTAAENASADEAPPSSTPSVNTTAPTTGPMISFQPGFVGMPFLSGPAMRVQSYPLEIHSLRSAVAMPRPQNNNNNTVNTTPASSAEPAQTTNGDDVTSSTEGGTTTTTTTTADGQQRGPQGAAFNFNNPNVEFFMEVTPEGITIDSLETSLVGSNQANDLLRGAIDGPSPEFLQSLMQMAGHLINRVPASSGPSATAPMESAPSPQQTATTQVTTPVAVQNSQARGNTQTHPTMATYTRSTTRPHVQIAQQALQGGFDPFLPCNSHHLSRRRLVAAAAAASAASAPQPSTNDQENARQADVPTPDPPVNIRETAGEAPRRGGGLQNTLLNVMDSLFRGIPMGPARGNEATRQSATGQSAPPTAAPNPSGGMMDTSQLASLFSMFQNVELLSGGGRRSPTLEQILQRSMEDYMYVDGENIFTDLIMVFIRNLTISDLFALSTSNTEPINRHINEIQNFFKTRICEGNTTHEGIDRGVDRLIAEMQPFLENFRYLAVKDDIDMVRSAEQLFRQRLPNIINIAINLHPNSVRLLVDQCITTAKQLVALALFASLNGQQGVEQVNDRIMEYILQDYPPSIQNWTLMTSRNIFQQVVSQVSVPDSILQPYIVRQSEAALPSVVERRQNNLNDNNATVNSESASPDVEAMELEDQVPSGSEPGSPTIEETEPLPNIVLGSEPWHGQVPENWVPIITRDAQKQRRQNPQGPFSDAYLSGMPSKRRKIINSSKPQGSLPQVITDSVRQAVTATGLSSVAPLETVAQAAGDSPEIQTAYRHLLRSTVQATLRENEDFLPERFPNASTYFRNGQQ